MAASEPRTLRPRLNRRTFLRGGAATLLVVTGGSVWRAVSRGVFATGTGPAYEPWRTWRTARPAGPLGVAHAGILAANPHNTQPWGFRVGESDITLYADTARNLGAFDPYLREMYLGLGCAVENMMQAAAALGYEGALTFEPGTLPPADAGGTLVPVAHLALRAGTPQVSALYAAIPDRHTNRGPYDTGRPVAPATLDQLAAQATAKDLRVFWLATDAERRAFGNVTVQATREIIADEEMVRDSQAWFRHTWREVQAQRDGVTLDTVGLPRPVAAIAKMLPPLSADAAHRSWLQATAKVHCATAAAFGLLAVRDLYDREQALRAGRAWQRMHLWATAHDVALHPLNQIIERVDRDAQTAQPPRAASQLATFTGDPSWRPTFAFRLGYAAHPALPSPRRALTDVVV